MDILVYTRGGNHEPWRSAFSAALPDARVRAWRDGDTAPADYAIVWRPHADVLRQRAGLKAIFNLGAGVDALLALHRDEPGLWPAHVPLVRLGDAGMGPQMVEYVTWAVLRYFRRFDEYAHQQAERRWHSLPPRKRDAFSVGILGCGMLGAQVGRTLAGLGFPVRGWRRSVNATDDHGGITMFHGTDGFDAFLADTQVLVNMLPLTPQTERILDRTLFAKLPRGAYLVNVARGGHLAEPDLLDALADGRIAGATLDVFDTEPLPDGHPFWREPRITITPHVAALTLYDESVAQIIDKIHALERGEPIDGVVDLARGY